MTMITPNDRRHLNGYAVTACALLVLVAGGCSVSERPRVRLGSYATPTPGTNFLDLETIGNHNYNRSWSEKNGIVYTCHGGHIDIAHLRITADYVRYLYQRIVRNLLETDEQFRFKLNVERSWHYVTITYPEKWATLPKKKRKEIADKAALELARYCTFMMATWHEVLTYFGYKTTGFISEAPSAFSWEDSYSNVLGIHLGTFAIESKIENYNAIMTWLINRELESLGIQPAATARAAAEQMRGTWYEGTLFVNMKVRNMDIGQTDGMVTPLLVPGICPGAKPRSYPAPTLKRFEKYGFGMKFEAEPREFERSKFMKLSCPQGGCKRLTLPDDMMIILDHIEKQFIEEGREVIK